MRFYSFTNYYLSPLQQGIQTQHCATDMHYKYRFTSSMEPKYMDDWALNHKTTIVLNGGNCAALSGLYSFLTANDNPYPFCFFMEDEQSLNNALTCVGVILPEKIYEGANILRDRRSNIRTVSDGENIIVSGNGEIYEHEYTTWEVEMMTRLNQYRLA